MKSLITTGDGTAKLVDVAEPVAGSGELLVAPIAAGICGTDLEIISGDGDPAFVKYPASLGHEWAGKVIGHGAGVSKPAIGLSGLSMTAAANTGPASGPRPASSTPQIISPSPSNKEAASSVCDMKVLSQHD
jgi:NADPH:quinone reductase-like Zn-dependent oxidoreductase